MDSLSSGITVEFSKDAYAVVGDIGEVASSEDLQPSSNDTLSVAHDATIAPADSLPWKSSYLSENTREPMHLVH